MKRALERLTLLAAGGGLAVVVSVIGVQAVTGPHCDPLLGSRLGEWSLFGGLLLLGAAAFVGTVTVFLAPQSRARAGLVVAALSLVMAIASGDSIRSVLGYVSHENGCPSEERAPPPPDTGKQLQDFGQSPRGERF
jgi:hypothetical protein